MQANIFGHQLYTNWSMHELANGMYELQNVRSFRTALYLSLKIFAIMNYVQRLEHWGEAHHPKYLDILRIALGIFLLLKGNVFANNSAMFTESM